MNVVAHVAVAFALATDGQPDTDFAFGAALPDLVPLAGLRIESLALPEAVREGVAFHHRTDACFHSVVEFTTGVRHLREQLRAGGLAVGPSRAVGHAGWELLLDGALLGRPGTEEDFARVLECAPDVAASLSPADPERWRRLLTGMRSDRWWLGYREAATVAVRLQRRLSARSRLAFAEGDLPLVVEALAAAKPAVEAAAGGVMLAVANAVAGSIESS